MPRSVADLQRQIEELADLVDAQNRQVDDANQQIAALQAAAANAPVIGQAQAGVAAQDLTSNFPRIPDLIRMIPEFSGNPKNLPRWIESVEEKLEVSKRPLSELERDRVVPIWMGIIRDKITEKANDALSASHTPLEWEAIKTTLVDFFGDKRDLSSLVSKMTNLHQGSQNVSEFYYECRSLLADINAKILINYETRNHAKAIMGTYETLMINAFIDGLRDPMSALVRISRPQNLTEAYQSAAEQESAMRRRREKSNFKPSTPLNHFKTSHNSRPNPNPSYPNSRPNPHSSYQNPRQNPNSSYQNTSSFQRPQASQNHTKQLAIKQEPRSQTGFKQNSKSYQPNSHEHCCAPPQCSHCFHTPSNPSEVHSNLFYQEIPEENYEQDTENPQQEAETTSDDEINFTNPSPEDVQT